jgi:hypothetical protein
MKRDENTYGSVTRKYDDWREAEKDKPAPPRVRSNRPYVHQPYERADMGKTVFAAIGIGIGLVLLLLSLLSFLNANRWADFGRDSAVVGWSLVGFFLLVAGLGAVISTWNHNFRVLASEPARHD